MANRAGNSSTKMPDVTVANVAGNSASGDFMFVCWLVCLFDVQCCSLLFSGVSVRQLVFHVRSMC